MDIQNNVKKIDTVTSVEKITSRSLDPNSVTLWVETASSILTVAGTAFTLIKNICEIFRKKKISNVKIRLPKDIEISVDEASAEEIQRILDSVSKE